ncbi:arginase [Roseiarcaceae bacterium H3SJ34-1]|uniref:arginase n=1 Tax=Terripilifer ovatus TaxID=3032367 RepID=UPI003AB9503B|nr:arginase [Roseiarcaceae bacterium H3SJ34-1]
MHYTILAAPIQDGAGRGGCHLAPAALRAAGLAATLKKLGHEVEDVGVIEPGPTAAVAHANHALKALPQIAAWIPAVTEAAYRAGAGREVLPIFLGGDHVISAGTLPGVARSAAERGRPLFVLWLDAHPDFHTLDTTESGHLHGVPLAYACGLPGFTGYFPRLDVKVEPTRVCAMGLRSVDPAERHALAKAGVLAYDMQAIAEHGVVPLLETFLARVAAENGMLHVSFDVDFLDPTIAPAAGTTVPGGVSKSEAYAIMDLLHESGSVTSFDLVEFNPLLDESGRTATLLIDLVARLIGRRSKTENFEAFDHDSQIEYCTLRQC